MTAFVHPSRFSCDAARWRRTTCKVEISQLHRTFAVAVDALLGIVAAEFEQYGRPFNNSPELEATPPQLGVCGSMEQFDVEYPTALTISQVSPIRFEIVPLGVPIVTAHVGPAVKV